MCSDKGIPPEKSLKSSVKIDQKSIQENGGNKDQNVWKSGKNNDQNPMLAKQYPSAIKKVNNKPSTYRPEKKQPVTDGQEDLPPNV